MVRKTKKEENSKIFIYQLPADDDDLHGFNLKSIFRPVKK